MESYTIAPHYSHLITSPQQLKATRKPNPQDPPFFTGSLCFNNQPSPAPHHVYLYTRARIKGRVYAAHQRHTRGRKIFAYTHTHTHTYSRNPIKVQQRGGISVYSRMKEKRRRVGASRKKMCNKSGRDN